MRKLIFLACAVVFVSAQAPADPVMTHYRAYRAAVAAGDMAAADREAQGALDASIARDQDGGRTGVLAYNLAGLRVGNERPAEAYDPALRAFNIAASNADSGLDQLLTRLMLGRAELTPERGEAGQARLLAALEEAASRQDIVQDAYDAAFNLGRWSETNRTLELSVTAWSYAARYAAGAPEDRDFAFGDARLREGIARLAILASRENAAGRGRASIMTRLPEEGRSHFAEYPAAYEAFTEAALAFAPLAHAPPRSTELTVSQAKFAQALGLRALVNSRLLSRLQDRLPWRTGVGAVAEGSQLPVCDTRVVSQPRPYFPNEMLMRDTMGVVVVRFLVDESGSVTDVRTASAVPEGNFQQALERVVSQWRLERAEGAAANCRFPPVEFQVVAFRFD